jgi:hypothetical protein
MSQASISRLCEIAIEERRQLITLIFAVVVFMLTLWALKLHHLGRPLNPVFNRTSQQRPGPALSATGAGNHATALALMTAPTEPASNRTARFIRDR